MTQNNDIGPRRRYLPPGLTVVSFATERGFAATGNRHILDEFTFSTGASESPSTGENRQDQGWLF